MVDFATPFNRMRLSATSSAVEDSGWHEYRWNLSPTESATLVTCCDSKSWRYHGTTPWFEDVVGHVGTADETAFTTR